MLERIKSREDLLLLNLQEEQILCAEIREFLLEHVARTGGHLASNLGVVELTVALHKTFDTSRDRLVWDVGHQSYVHKILTGRCAEFSSLRTYGGLSGFPKPSESNHDSFIAGHASNAVSAALGMARARTLSGLDYHVAAVLGDGALTGGLAYEGLNDAGQSGEPLIIILNDNGMSIKPNVGAVSHHLSLLRLKPGYFGLKKAFRQISAVVPGGRFIYRAVHKTKLWLHKKLLGVTLFEEMGFHYLGPVDGHDLGKLTFLLHQAKEMQEPVLLHVITQKGKGYTPAEAQPSSFHAVGSFDPVSGFLPSEKPGTFSHTFGEALCSLAEADKRICAITAAMESGTGLGGFAKRFPKRYFDVAIAEGHAVTMAAGLAKQGMIPVFAVYSTFLQRAYDMLLHDVSLLQLHVVLAVDRAGLVGEDGETHHGLFDVGFLRSVPGMRIFCPASQKELQRMLHKAVLETDGPVAIRYRKGSDCSICRGSAWRNQTEGDAHVTIVTYGTTIWDVLNAAEALRNSHIGVHLIKMDQIAPIDLREISDSVCRTGRLVFVEEAAENGSVGQAVCSALGQQGCCFHCRLLNAGDGIVPHGDRNTLKKMLGIDSDGIIRAVKELIGDEE